MNISALDENGEAVDWWFAYKVPQLAKDADSLNATGYEYVYYDAKADKVVKSSNLLTDNKGAVDLTLQSVFAKPDDTTGWILYNDEMPADAKRTDSSSFGHTKGVIAFDTDSKTALMPTPIYGQTYLCLSLDLATASQIANQMANHQEPQVYVPRIPASLDKSDPLYVLTQTLNPNTRGDADVIDCKSRGGLPFKVIAKNRKWNKDFWNDLVGPTLGADMRDETWIRGKIPPILDSDGIHKTFDVSFVDFRPLGVPWAWPETHDHAKWGITVDSDWVCVGDINRMISQEKRGGGTIAFQEPTLWAALSKTDLQIYPPGYSGYAAQKLVKATHATTHESLSEAVARKAAPEKPKPQAAAKKKAVPKKKAATKKKPATKKKARAAKRASSPARKKTVRKSASTKKKAKRG
jgi:deoxyribonuclease-2